MAAKLSHVSGGAASLFLFYIPRLAVIFYFWRIGLDAWPNHQFMLPLRCDKLSVSFQRDQALATSTGRRALKSFWLFLFFPCKLLEEYSFRTDYLFSLKTRIQTCCTFSPTNAGHIGWLMCDPPLGLKVWCFCLIWNVWCLQHIVCSTLFSLLWL